MQAVSTLDSTAQPQHAQKDLEFLGTFSVPKMINVLEHHGMLEVGLLSLQVVHVSIGETGVYFQGTLAPVADWMSSVDLFLVYVCVCLRLYES